MLASVDEEINKFCISSVLRSSCVWSFFSGCCFDEHITHPNIKYFGAYCHHSFFSSIFLVNSSPYSVAALPWLLALLRLLFKGGLKAFEHDENVGGLVCKAKQRWTASVRDSGWSTFGAGINPRNDARMRVERY